MSFILAQLTDLRNIIPTPEKDISCQDLLKTDGIGKHGFLRRPHGRESLRFLENIFKTRWHQKYVVLRLGCIYVYESETSTKYDSASTLFGCNQVVPVSESGTGNSRWSFKIVSALEEKEKCMCFGSPSQDSMQEWMRCIKKELIVANVGLFNTVQSSPSNRLVTEAINTPVIPRLSSSEKRQIRASMVGIPHEFLNSVTSMESGIGSDESGSGVRISAGSDEEDYSEIPADGNADKDIDRDIDYINIPDECTTKFAQPNVQDETPVIPPKIMPRRKLSITISLDEQRDPRPKVAPKPWMKLQASSDVGPLSPPGSAMTVNDRSELLRQRPVPQPPVFKSDVPPEISTQRRTSREGSMNDEEYEVEGEKCDGENEPFYEVCVSDANRASELRDPMVYEAYWPGDAASASKAMESIDEEGVYMLRKSSDDHEFLTLVVKLGEPKLLRKYKIVKDQQNLFSLFINDLKFATIAELLRHYRTSPLPKQDTLTLTRPYSEVLPP